MSQPPRVKAENTSLFPSRESEMQGLSAVMPETPQRRLESRTVSPVTKSWRKMFGMPKRSDTKTMEEPPGPHCGEMFVPFWFGSTVTVPLETSRLKNLSVSKLPVRSPSTSFLKIFPFRAEARYTSLYMLRSEMKTICVPLGETEGATLKFDWSRSASVSRDAIWSGLSCSAIWGRYSLRTASIHFFESTSTESPVADSRARSTLPIRRVLFKISP